MTPEEFEQNEATLPQTVSLTFACGLGYLRQIDYLQTDESYYTGREREIVILAQASLSARDSTVLRTAKRS